MQIQRDGRVNDLFAAELAKAMQKTAKTPDETIEKQLDEAGEQKNDSGANKEQISQTMEPQLKKERSGESEEVHQSLPEKQLEKKREAGSVAAPNADKSGITEKRLNEAKYIVYPHRNENAYKRTGDKRPVNALREEMGDMSDEAKDERYEKASKKSQNMPKRILDKNIGEQMVGDSSPKVSTAFNLREQREAALSKKLKAYIDYKSNKVSWTVDHSKVKEVDSMMEAILAHAQSENRQLNDEEKSKITALKSRKGELLRISGK